MKVSIKHPVILMIFLAALSFTNCDTVEDFNIFTVEDDIALGRQVSEEIESNPQEFPILPESGNEVAYSYLRNIVQKILNEGDVQYREEFPWQVKMIADDETQNAFAAPGGFIYVYTGLIKFLDTEHQLAGVLGHEIAHAAQRHSTSQMTKIYGLDALRYIITGNADPGLLEEVALGLVSLQFSRDHEEEADEYSVRYLCPTHYKADGAAGFFEKIEGQGGTPPEFLSTHPNPEDRVADIKSLADELNCAGTRTFEMEYEDFKRSLP